jgi:hypothetical protein
VNPIDPATVHALRREGHSYAEIGRRLGTTKDAARGTHTRWLDRGGATALAHDVPVAGDGGAGPDDGRCAPLPAEGPDGPSGPDGSGEVAALRASNNRLLRQLTEAKSSKDEYVEAVYRAVSDAAAAIDIPSPRPPQPDPRESAEEVAVAVLSDWQLGKRTPSYDSAICAERIALYADKVISLTEIQRKDHPVKHLRVHILGDIIEGEQIFPGQAHLIDSSLFEQTTETGPTILIGFLTKMLEHFETVHVVAVIGNHGRIGRRGDFNPQTNGDRMLYRNTQRILEGRPGFERLTWDIPSIPNERAWYAVSRIGNYAALLIHGDQFRGTAGIPWYGLMKKAGGWALGAIDEKFDDVDFGHYHQPTRVTLNNVTARCSGSPESHNDFAAEQLAAVGRPSQSLRFVHPERGIVTAEYVCWL